MFSLKWCTSLVAKDIKIFAATSGTLMSMAAKHVSSQPGLLILLKYLYTSFGEQINSFICG